MKKMDLVVLDLGLPVKDGWQTIQWLTRVNPHLPVIIITGRCNQRESAEKMGAQVLMEKPLDVPSLLQLIRELIEVPMESRKMQPFGFRHVSGARELVLTSLTECCNTPPTILGGRSRDWQGG
jgi:DNA-binding response OmpR family regulator